MTDGHIVLDKSFSSAYIPDIWHHGVPSGANMKNVYEVLRQKELELTRLEKEVEALRIAAPLLSEEKESLGDSSALGKNGTATPIPQQPLRVPQPAVATAARDAARPTGWEETAKRWP